MLTVTFPFHVNGANINLKDAVKRLVSLATQVEEQVPQKALTFKSAGRAWVLA